MKLECVQPGESLYGLQLTNNQRIVPFGGGFPIIVDGQVVGAVGVSGGTVEEDMSIAKAAVDAFTTYKSLKDSKFNYFEC